MPKQSKDATKTLSVRVSMMERLSWQSSADECGQTMAEWIRRQCNATLEGATIATMVADEIVRTEFRLLRYLLLHVRRHGPYPRTGILIGTRIGAPRTVVIRSNSRRSRRSRKIASASIPQAILACSSSALT